MISNYHLCIWADNVGSDGAVQVILNYLEQMDKREAEKAAEESAE